MIVAWLASGLTLALLRGAPDLQPRMVAPTPGPLAQFERLRDSLAAMPHQEQSDAVRQFAEGFRGRGPLISGEHVLFLAAGDPAAPPVLQCDLNGFAEAGSPMTRLGESDWFFREEKIPWASRIEYRFGDGRSSWRDPLNPLRTESFPGEVSVLEGPGWSDDPADWGPPPQGVRLLHFELASEAMGQNRPVVVQLPAGYRVDDPGQDRLPVLYLLDGDLLLRNGYAELIGWLMEKPDGIPPCIVVYVPPVDRRNEYRGDPRHRRFITEELVPAVDRRWRTLARADARAVLGHSRGGLGALNLALGDPLIFGRCVALSPAVNDTGLLDAIRRSAGAARRFTLVECRYDLRWRGDVALLREALEAAGHEVTATRINGGHNLGTWRRLLPTLVEGIWTP